VNTWLSLILSILPAAAYGQTAPVGESPYIFGLHEPGGETLFEQARATGWIVFTEALGTERPPNDYSAWAQKGHGVIVRLNYGYPPIGTLPCAASDEAYRAMILNFIGTSKGGHIWIIGNEMNLPEDWSSCPVESPVAPEPITVERYASFFSLTRSAIKALPGHEQDQVIPGAVSWAPPGADAANLDYNKRLIAALGAVGGADGIAIHNYTQGNDPSVFSCAAKGLPGKKSGGFQAYRDRINDFPPWAKSLPVYITESRPRPWDNVNSGWVQNAYCEINEWNKTAGNPKIKALVLFRWNPRQQNDISKMPNVQEDLRQALDNANMDNAKNPSANAYRW
jgi:hypothetical protein